MCIVWGLGLKVLRLQVSSSVEGVLADVHRGVDGVYTYIYIS